MLALLLIAGSLGLSNLAASVGIGISGVDGRLRLRLAGAFGLFEAGMPIVGLLVGRAASHSLGGSAHVIGGLLLTGVGLQATRAALHPGDEEPPGALATVRTGRLLLLAAALSLDNLVAGFALGAVHTALILSVATIGAVSVGLSLIGLELGARLGAQVEHGSEVIGGIVLVGVGLAILAGVI